MREIKFRAWDGRRKIMLSPEQLDKENRSLGAHGLMVAMDEDSKASGHLWNTDWIKPLFWTGLKDMRDEPIFDGDIIRYFAPGEGAEPFVGEVYWSQSKLAWDVDDQNQDLSEVCEWFNDIQVLGNVYEHGNNLIGDPNDPQA